ncbi:MAG: hypothetical protein PHD43_01485 [Methylococcales bacterium]|nr:hypothetical protein [Methylococcales bacterium]
MSKTIGQRCARVDEIMGCQLALLPAVCPLAMAREAQRIAALSAFIELLAGQGINGAQSRTIIGFLIARRATPGLVIDGSGPSTRSGQVLCAARRHLRATSPGPEPWQRC